MIVTRCPTRIVLAGEGTDTLLTVAIKLYVHSALRNVNDYTTQMVCFDISEVCDGIAYIPAQYAANRLATSIQAGDRMSQLEAGSATAAFQSREDVNACIACALGGVNLFQGKKHEKLTLGKLGTSKLESKLLLVFGDVGLNGPKLCGSGAITSAVRHVDWSIFHTAVACNPAFRIPKHLEMSHCKTHEPMILGTKWLSPNLSLFVCKSYARRDVKKRLEERGLRCVPVEIDTAGVVCLLGPNAQPRRTTAKRKARCKWNSCQRDLPTGPVEQRALAFCSRECASDFEKLYGHL